MAERHRATIEALIGSINAGDLERFHAQFQPDSEIEYAQSGERIVGDANRRGVYGNFPQLPKLVLRRYRESGDLVVVEAEADYGGEKPYRAVFIFEMRDGKIARETGYWSEAFPPAEWRAKWVEMA